MELSDKNRVPVYLVVRRANSSRGLSRRVEYFCATRSTAERLAHKNELDGSNSEVVASSGYLKDGQLYHFINSVSPTEMDVEKEKLVREEERKKEARDRAIEKIKALGVVKADIDALLMKD